MCDAFVLDRNQFERCTPGDLLGAGRFGKVYKVNCKQDPTKPFPIAMRVLGDHGMGGNAGGKHLFREVAVFQTIKPHPCFCLFRGFLLDPPTLVTDFMANGSLQSILDRLWKGTLVREFTPTVRAKTAFGFAVAMMQLHAGKVMHRYLSPKNIFYDEQWDPKLADFGFARVISESEDVSKGFTTIGDTGDFWVYTAPEAFTSGHYDLSVDVWSYGMIFYTLITGKKPLPRDAEKKQPQAVKTAVFTKNARPDIPDTVDVPVKTLIENCWQGDPNQRPKFAEIVRDLLHYDDPLLDGVDMDEYRAYRDKIMDATPLSPEDAKVVNGCGGGAVDPRTVADFEKTKREAEAGDMNKLAKLGKMILAGSGTEANPTEACACFRRSADAGNKLGMFNLANCLLKGIGTKRDLPQAFSWLEKSAHGFPVAEYTLGRCLQEGIGTPKNAPRALEIFKRLALPPHNRGDAMNSYAEMLEENEATAAEARTWYQKARDQGVEAAACNLALMLLDGKGGPGDIAEGIRIYERGAQQHFPMACYNLGLIYQRGLYGQTVDLVRAEEMYREAMKSGMVMPHVKLSNMRLAQASACSNPAEKFALEAEAIEILEKVKATGESTVLNNLGKLIMQGRGVRPTAERRKEAMSLLKRVARRPDGGSTALYLGDLLSNPPPGINHDVAGARQFYEMAAARGQAEARAKLANLK